MKAVEEGEEGGKEGGEGGKEGGGGKKKKEGEVQQTEKKEELVLNGKEGGGKGGKEGGMKGKSLDTGKLVEKEAVGRGSVGAKVYKAYIRW